MALLNNTGALQLASSVIQDIDRTVQALNALKFNFAVEKARLGLQKKRDERDFQIAKGGLILDKQRTDAYKEAQRARQKLLEEQQRMAKQEQEWRAIPAPQLAGAFTAAGYEDVGKMASGMDVPNYIASDYLKEAMRNEAQLDYWEKRRRNGGGGSMGNKFFDLAAPSVRAAIETKREELSGKLKQIQETISPAAPFDTKKGRYVKGRQVRYYIDPQTNERKAIYFDVTRDGQVKLANFGRNKEAAARNRRNYAQAKMLLEDYNREYYKYSDPEYVAKIYAESFAKTLPIYTEIGQARKAGELGVPAEVFTDDYQERIKRIAAASTKAMPTKPLPEGVNPPYRPSMYGLDRWINMPTEQSTSGNTNTTRTKPAQSGNESANIDWNTVEQDAKELPDDYLLDDYSDVDDYLY